MSLVKFWLRLWTMGGVVCAATMLIGCSGGSSSTSTAGSNASNSSGGSGSSVTTGNSGNTGGSGGSASGGTGSSGGGNTKGTAPLNGQYAFDLAGFDLAGYPMALAGSITADGQGHITAGSVDVNDFGQLNSSTAVSGTYTLDSNYRGLITLNPVGTIPYPLMFNFTLKANGTLADLIEDNQSSQTFFFTTGRMQKQDPTAFSLPSLAGSYSFLLESNMQCRRSSVGRFTMNQDGSTSNGLVDISKGGAGPILTDAALSANFGTAGPDANGRGTLSMVTSDGASTYSYYAVSANELLLIETDSSQAIDCGLPSQTIYAGLAAKQTVATSSAAVNTPGSVFYLTGLNVTLDQSTASIGVLRISSGNMATVQWDTNNNDNFFGPTSVSGAPVTFDPNTGRGTISVTNGSAQGLFDQAAFYLVNAGTAFLLEATPGSANQALTGRMEPQIGIGSFSPSMIAGNMIGGTTTGNSSNNIDTFDLLFTVQSNGTMSSIQDQNNRGCGTIPLSVCMLAIYGFRANVTFSGISISGVDTTTGRGVLTIPNPNGGSPAKEIFYLIGPSHFVFIDETLFPPNVFTPIWGFTPIFRFDPQ